MADTAIEWTHRPGTKGAVWNPTTGCDKKSPGCDRCYALTMAARLKAMGQAKYQTDGDPRTSGPGFGVAVHEDALTIPLAWRTPRTVFGNSMSDLWHARVPRAFTVRVFAVMSLTRRHTYQWLTKRPDRMARMLSDPMFWAQVGTAAAEFAATGSFDDVVPTLDPMPNVWLGTSVEDQERADERIPDLLATPAAVRFLSCEPLLGPIDLAGYLPRPVDAAWYAVECRHGHQGCPVCDRPLNPSEAISWVIAGGESGPKARPMHPDWARSLRDQCQAAGVPFFFKQWGAWVPYEEDAQPPFLVGQDGETVDGHYLPEALTDERPIGGWWWPGIDEPGDRTVIYRRHSKKAGRRLDGREWSEYPEAVRHG